MAGRMNSIDVFLKLYGGRAFAKELAASGAELEAMGLKGAKAMSRFAASGARLKSFGRSWTRNVSLPIVGLGVVAGGMAAKFDRSMSLISSQAGGTQKEVGKLKGEVLGLAKESQYGPEELAKSLFFIESAGKRGSAAMQLLRANVKLATTGNSDLEHTTFGTVGAMNALGKEGKNFTKIAATMNATVGHGHMYMEELVSAMGTGLVGADKSFGVSFEGTNAALAYFTRIGEPAQQAATRLRQTISHLATSSTTKGAEALESIGLSAERMGARIRKTGTIGPVIKELAEHLKGVSKGRANQILTEAFGGGRFGTQIREATQQVGLFLRTEREIGKSGTIKELNKGFGIAKQQPMVKLKETWSSIQASLIEIGEALLPTATSVLQRFAGWATKAGKAFVGLPASVKEVGLGFLVLTGPVASGLGYFAGGIGRALILTKKLAYAGKDLGAFSWALKSGQSVGGASSYAFRGAGIAGALQTAKGFAFSIGPAVGLYGIGNILTSALSGDWKEAGFEAGGALAGGIAGFFLTGGNPLGAMLGVGIGSLGGELLSGLFGSDKKTETAQERFAKSAQRVKSALDAQRKAGQALTNSSGALVAAHHRQGTASQKVKNAEHALAVVRGEAGPDSLPVLRAEVHLAKAGERRIEVTKKLHKLEHLKGENLSLFKQTNAYAILQQRAHIKELKSKVAESKAQRTKLLQEGITGKRLAQADEALIGRKSALWKEHTSLLESFQEAEKKAGPAWERFVQKANTRGLELRRGLRGIKEEAQGLEKALRKLSENGTLVPGGLVEQGLRHAIHKAHNEEGQLGHPRGAHPSHHGHRKTAAGAPRPRVKKLMAGGLGKALHIAVESTLLLDGKEVANNTTHHVLAEAARA